MRPRGRFKCKNNALGIYYKNNFDHLLNIRPPHFASKVSYSASLQSFVAPYYLAKNADFFCNKRKKQGP